MNKKRAILVDDETKSRTALNSFLTKYCPTIEIVGEADGVKSGLEVISSLNPDVLFLDIEMNDGTGFDLLEKLAGITFEVIFVTAFNQYAIKAFRYSAIDYLLKPVNPEELVQAVTKLTDDSRISQIEQKLEALMSNRSSIQKIAIPSMTGIRLEEVGNIMYCESDNYYTIIHLVNGERLMVSKTLKEYDKTLSEDGFIRIHQKYLVKVSEIKTYSKSEGGFVTLTDGTNLTVSRRKKEELLKAISNHS
ncbi:MAG: LytTR family DNA-binding domain-containing protein [Cyclobacteriaceae bacterium]